MSQPDWELIGQLGDADPVEYGGYFIYRDKTGVYAEEAEYFDAPEDEEGEYTIYRFILERCTLTKTLLGDIVSENKFHPEIHAWFAKPEFEKNERPQDNTYLSNIARYSGSSVKELQKLFCSENALERAEAYRLVGMYHGFINFDEYPLTMKRREVEKRYEEETETPA